MRKALIAIPLTVLIIAALACGGEATAEAVATAVPEEMVEEEPEEEVIEPSEEPLPEPTEEPTPEPTAAPETYAIGDTVAIGDFTLTVNGFSVLESDNQFIQPDEGQRFVVVDLTIANQGSESRPVSSWLQMKLKDDTFQVYEVDLMAATEAGTTPDGEIAPGETIRGQVGYQVPEDAGGFVFVFDADVWGLGKVFFELGEPSGPG